MLDDAFLALVAAPIPGAAPGGTNVRYDEPYTLLEMEMSKLENPAGGEPDWKRAIELAKSVLGSHSKDILACVWATYAGQRVGRLQGLAIGLNACRELLTTWWDAGFPALPRVKARRNALEWLGERAAAAITPQDVASPQGQETLGRCLTALDALDQLASARFEGEDSGLSAIRRALRDLQGRGAGAAVAAAPTATGAAPQGAIAAGAPAAVFQPQVNGQITCRADAMARLSEITEYFRQAEPHSPMGYLLARALAWNSKSFEEVMLELLRNREDAQRQVFDDLGMKLPPKNRN
jgi:type VI secretion system protein VasJ